ncbi:MAG: polysaccharide biosynthesis C-terminal domain-containing protein, partial [Ignavibacteriaceae bacterium]|nr:polysaccharide biosynthesis C-terminal domain-containing protein [Ignavibacteriaceae bacterium]
MTLTIKQHIKYTLGLAYPVIIGQLGFIMMGVVDSIMVGVLGPTPLAAASLANSYIILIFIIGLGISFVVTPLVAIEVGANRKSECGVLFRQSLIINMVVGVITTAVTFFASYLLFYFDQPVEVVNLAQSYTILLGCSAIPTMLFQTYKQFIEGLSVMRPAMIITLLANIINIIANWLFIYGNFGMPALGLNGAGIATLSSRIFMALFI